MPYELLADGKPVPLGDRKYLLSPQDLAGLDVLPELVRLGVASLKIEGRLKTPEYVANITRLYRNALDRLAPGAVTSPRAGADDRYRMEMAFSRGLYTGWFRGINNQELVHGRFGKKRGVYLGEVAEVRRDSVALNLQAALKAGDGIVFDAGHPESDEEGGRVYEVRPIQSSRSSMAATKVLLYFGQGDIDFSKVHVGDKVWKTSDPELDRALRATYEGDTPKFQRPVHAEVHGASGQPLTLVLRDDQGHVVRVDSSLALANAEKQPLSEARLREQLGRLGGTAYKLGKLSNLLSHGLMLPVSELNRIRREAVQQLDLLRARPLRWALNPGASNPPEITRLLQNASPGPISPGVPQIIVLVRSLGQLEAAIGADVRRIYCELEDPKRYRDAVALVRAAPLPGHEGADAGSRVGPTPRELFVAPPRIFKLGEEWTLKQTRSCEADGYLVRNFDHLKFFASDRCVGDYSLNIANRLSADYFKNRFNLERITASYDLNAGQLEALLRAAPPDWFEITLHQHMPMFHMEHCVFCAFLSQGKDYRDCGRPCDVHELRLRDRVGAAHPVKADAGCRNTVFNAKAQTGADFVQHFLALGAVHFRLEFLDESPSLVTQTITKYRQLLRGEITGAQLWRELKLFNQLGVTRGQIAG
jgi:putative protease